MLPFLPLRQLIQWRPRDRIAREFAIQIKLDPRISRLIKRRSFRSTAQGLRPRALDLEIYTLRIRLGSIFLARGMQCNNLVPDDVVARRNIRGNSR